MHSLALALALTITAAHVDQSIRSGDPCEAHHTPAAIAALSAGLGGDVYQEDQALVIDGRVYLVPEGQVDNLWQLCYGSGFFRPGAVFLVEVK